MKLFFVCLVSLMLSLIPAGSVSGLDYHSLEGDPSNYQFKYVYLKEVVPPVSEAGPITVEVVRVEQSVLPPFLKDSFLVRLYTITTSTSTIYVALTDTKLKDDSYMQLESFDAAVSMVKSLVLLSQGL